MALERRRQLGDAYELTLMGSFKLLVNETTVGIQGVRPRVILALLALASPGEKVSTDQLSYALWGETPPPTLRNTIQAHVTALRRSLRPVDCADIVLFSGSAYHLSEQIVVDVTVFRNLIRQARAKVANGDLVEAEATFVKALSFAKWPMMNGLKAVVGGDLLARQLEQEVDSSQNDYILIIIHKGQIALAITLLEKQLTRNRYNETAWARLLYCHRVLGNNQAVHETRQRAEKSSNGLGLTELPLIRRALALPTRPVSGLITIEGVARGA